MPEHRGGYNPVIEFLKNIRYLSFEFNSSQGEQVMNNITKIGLTAVAVLLIGGFLCLAAIDVPVKQNQIIKTIPNERFFKNN